MDIYGTLCPQMDIDYRMLDCLKHGDDNVGVGECVAATCREKQMHLQRCVLRYRKRCSSTEVDRPSHLYVGI